MTYTYRVTNPGNVPLASVALADDKCSSISAPTKTGGNADASLDVGETWTYTCTQSLTATTINTATASGYFGPTLKSAIATFTVTRMCIVPQFVTIPASITYATASATWTSVGFTTTLIKGWSGNNSAVIASQTPFTAGQAVACNSSMTVNK